MEEHELWIENECDFDSDDVQENQHLPLNAQLINQPNYKSSNDNRKRMKSQYYRICSDKSQ